MFDGLSVCARRSASGYLRGTGLASLIDPVTRRELEERKRRELQHQEAVRSQIEERERLKLLKKQQKILQARAHAFLCTSFIIIIVIKCTPGHKEYSYRTAL